MRGGFLACLCALAFVIPATRPLAVGIWALVNIGLMLSASVWGLFHVRQALGGRDLILKWAFWLSLLGTLALFAQIDSQIATQSGLRADITARFLGILGLILWPVLFITGIMAGFAGASLGGFLGRKQPYTPTLAANGVLYFWLATLFSPLLDTGLEVLTGDALREIPYLGVPFLAAGLWRLAQNRRRADVRSPLQRQMDRLVVRRTIRGESRRFDLRGGALGLAATLIVLLANQLNLLQPIQTTVLVQLIRLRSSLPLAADEPNITLLDTDPLHDLAPGTGDLKAESALAQVYDHFVLLDMNTMARHDSLTTSSEAAVQTQVIRRLHEWGAKRVILPLSSVALPPLPVKEASDIRTSAELRGMPLPTDADTARSHRDLPQLAAAMREAGNVILTAPHMTEEKPPDSAALRSAENDTLLLKAAAREVVDADIGSFQTLRLPALPTRWVRDAPLPILLASLLRGVAPTVVPDPDRMHAQIAGKSVPLVDDGSVLVAFPGNFDGSPFTHVSYSSVLRHETIYERAALDRKGKVSRPGRWLPPEVFFRNKIVFLDSVVPRTRETPLGTLSLNEVQAFAVCTLLTGRTVARVAPRLALLLALLLGPLIGILCTRRAPLDALWRVACLLLLLLTACALLFYVTQKWFDPLVPLMITAVAFLLATQFTYAQEREERERNRALLQRFVAPQVVDEFLDTPEKLGLGGTRRRICVLFADVRNFTGFAESHTPEEVIEVVNTYMTDMTDALDLFGGILDKYTGDGLMAFFPVGEIPRYDIEKAVQAAIAMRNAAENLSQQRIAEGKEALRVGIGMHYGEAVIGMVGNPVRQINYTALGHTVVVSARLQTLAQGGEVIVSDTVQQEAQWLFTMDGGDPVQVKGVTEPVCAYRVLAQKNGSGA